MIEDEGWKKDESPYLVFPCNKCDQFMHVKITQKTKKCLRCGRSHKVDSMLNLGEIVAGMTNAVNKVIQKQNELAVEELGSSPRFTSAEGFHVPNKKIIMKSEKKISPEGLEGKFKKMLINLSSSYKEFPIYLIEIMADNHDIPQSEIKTLIWNFQKRGILKKNHELLYEINECKLRIF